MIDAFLFDIGNVLLRFDFSVALRKLFRDSAPAAAEILELLEPIKAAYEAGRTTRAEFHEQTRALFRYTGSDEDFIAAWEDIFTENAPMVALVEELRGRYPLYLLSNTSDIHREFIFRRYRVFQHFRAGVYSYEARVSKPDPEIYRIAMRDLGLDPARTFFIDDLPANVATARELGFQAHEYRYEEHAALERELRAAGVAW